jgi:hypothetical protein
VSGIIFKVADFLLFVNNIGYYNYMLFICIELDPWDIFSANVFIITRAGKSELLCLLG